MSEDEAFKKYSLGGAYHWKWYFTNFEGYRDFVTAISDHFEPPATLLDVGCGDGLMSYVFFRLGLGVSGVDSSRLGVDLARRVSELALHGQFDSVLAGDDFPDGPETSALKIRSDDGALSFEVVEAEDLSGQPSYDYVTCVEVLEHVQHPEIVLRNLIGVCRRFCIVTTPDGTGEELGPYDHQLWTPETFEEFIGDYRHEVLNLRPRTLAAKIYPD